MGTAGARTGRRRGRRPGREAALPPEWPPHAHLLTGTPAEPPEPARPPAHEGEECLPSD